MNLEIRGRIAGRTALSHSLWDSLPGLARVRSLGRRERENGEPLVVCYTAATHSSGSLNLTRGRCCRRLA